MAEFKMNSSAAAFDILSTKLYSRPAEAIVRELLCNGLDAMVESGTDESMKVGFFKEGEDTFWFCRDYGNGLNPVEIEKIYTVFFASTKGYDNEQIGSFGLGSKSPFSLVNKYYVESIINEGSINKKYVYKMEKIDGLPNCNLESEEETFEFTGLKIYFEVNDYKILEDMRNAISTVRKNLSKYVVYETYEGGQRRDDDLLERDFEEYKSTYQNKYELYDFSKIVRNGYYMGFSFINVAINLGGYTYMLESSDMNFLKKSSVPGNHVHFLDSVKRRFNIIPELNFNKSEISLTPSRESVHFDDKTIDGIVKKLSEFAINLKRYVLDSNNASHIVALYKLFKDYGFSNVICDELEYRKNQAKSLLLGTVVLKGQNIPNSKIRHFSTISVDSIGTIFGESDELTKVIIATPGEKKIINNHILNVIYKRDNGTYVGMCQDYIRDKLSNLSPERELLIVCFNEEKKAKIYKSFSKDVDHITFDAFIENRTKRGDVKRKALPMEEAFFKEDCFTIEKLPNYYNNLSNKNTWADKDGTYTNKYVIMTNEIKRTYQYKDIAIFFTKIKELNGNTDIYKSLMNELNRYFENSCVRILKNVAQYNKMIANGYKSFSSAINNFINDEAVKKFFGILTRKYYSHYYKKLIGEHMFQYVDMSTSLLKTIGIEKDSLMYALVDLGNVEYENEDIKNIIEKGDFFVSLSNGIVTESHALRSELSETVDLYGSSGIFSEKDRMFISTIINGVTSESRYNNYKRLVDILNLFRDTINNYKVGPRFFNVIEKIDSLCSVA